MVDSMNSSMDDNFLPAGIPPPGVTPNFINPESIGYRLVIVAVVFPVIAGLFLLIRLYTAHFILRRWNIDDYFVVIAFVLAIGHSITNIIQPQHGAGTNIWNVSKVMFRDFNKLGSIAGTLFYHTSTIFAKLSILTFYLRFSSANRAFRLAAYFIMLVTLGYTLPMAFIFLYQCSPMARAWDERIVGQCINIMFMCNVTGILNALTDFTILVMPIWLLWPLRIPLMRKIGVTLIMMTGGFVCGISTMRTATVGNNTSDKDYTYVYVPNLVWFIVEMYFGIICACLPCLKPFTKRYFPGFLIFSSNLESRLSTSIHVASTRLANLTSFRRNARGGEGKPRSMSRIGADILHSKPSHSSMFGCDKSDPSSTTFVERGSRSEGSSCCKDFRCVGEKASGSTLRAENPQDGINMSEKADV